MTRDQMQSVHDDIAFMRALAEEGSQAPLLGGGVTASAGLIFGAAAVVHWMIQEHVLQVPALGIMAAWLIAGCLFAGAMMVVLRRVAAMPGAGSPLNRAVGSAWSGVGFAIFVSFLGLAAMAYSVKNPIIFNAFPVLILALYGAAWSVAADFSRKGWIRVVALASFVGAVVMGLMATSSMQMLAYAAALLLLAFVPGLLLLRQEPSDTI
jgi:hypothetical protein